MTDPDYSTYLATADVWTVLDLIAAEWATDPTSVAKFDLRLVHRAIDLAAARPDYAVALTRSQCMALRSLLLDYILWPRHTEVFVDVVRQVETTPEELLELFAAQG